MKRLIIMTAVLLLAVPAWTTAAAEEALHPVIRISEVMASNDSVATYPKAGFTDWVEIFNSGDTPVDLSGWGLIIPQERDFQKQTRYYSAFTCMQGGTKKTVPVTLFVARGAPNMIFLKQKSGQQKKRGIRS